MILNDTVPPDSSSIKDGIRSFSQVWAIVRRRQREMTGSPGRREGQMVDRTQHKQPETQARQDRRVSRDRRDPQSQ